MSDVIIVGAGMGGLAAARSIIMVIARVTMRRVISVH